MRDPKLALALAIHEGACKMIANEMAVGAAVKKSREAMMEILGEDPAHEGLDTSLTAIEAEFANGRFYPSAH
jgi:hypothetical protein